MARPKKTGIEYFPFDVDFFEDEKVLPVSVEFGAKGEIIVIRLLCAIYREGYFVQWSEGLKFKLANQAKVGENLVSDVVLKLVKYHFFNKELFNLHQILSSAGIQKRWKEATRKRVNLDEKRYWLLDEIEVSGGRNPVSGGRKAEETPSTQPESTQSKRKERKVSKKYNPVQYLIENGASEKQARFWIDFRRKVKKASVSEIVIDGIIQVATELNLSINDALKLQEERNWQGFKKDWVENALNQDSTNTSKKEPYKPERW